MAEDEMAHLPAAPAVAAEVDEDRVGPREKLQRALRGVLVPVGPDEAGDLQVADVPIQNFGSSHPEIELSRIASGPAAAGGRAGRA